MDCYVFEANNFTQAPFECNNVQGSPNLLTGVIEYAQYGYNPSDIWSYVFTAVFGVALLAQIFLGVFWRTWWTLPTLAAGTAVEVIGWGGRVWSVVSLAWTPNEGGVWDSAYGAYIMQICCLVIAPTFYSAANYILFGRIIAAAGPTYVSLHSQSFSTIFVIADIACLVIQGAGGGIAGTADDQDGSDMGAYIMTAGVILQLVVTIFFTGLFAEWLWRRRNSKPARRQFNPFARFYRKKNQAAAAREHIEMSPSATLVEDPSIVNTIKPEDSNNFASRSYNNIPFENTLPESKVKLMCGLIAFGTLLIIIRSVYRSVELLDGWEGAIAINEPLFLGLDAFLMAVFAITYAVVHPGLVFGRRLF
ncbi:hypothetical protein I302_107905 [Kwoniella bestiolae CBS 10118]|uniref:Uncharacterized protein n=1 Tax=Kwoniella bestiolae CBS 10118 TaxID=1296100 RepID=A0A1B9FX80_9TREE|nr:hypothetical protein I302_06353 [Kwoniella bestiolae CBS 10118]OCF23372.1 hypothetical protein I302_06353 [Kwoniella bestiolae CBS 10118]